LEKDDQSLRRRMRELANNKRRYGYRRLHILLKREGFVINHKRTERIYREEGLNLKNRKRKRRRSDIRLILPEVRNVNHIWAMDFMSDSLYNGRRFRILNIIDLFSRECIGIEVDFSITGHRVTRILDKIIFSRGKPEIIVCDNGPEFTGIALDQWAYRNGVKISFITAGKPVENAFIESFNGKFRDECLNDHWFQNINDAKNKIETWRIEYNNERPHSSLEDMTPVEFRNRSLRNQFSLIEAGI